MAGINLHGKTYKMPLDLIVLRHLDRSSDG